MGQHLLVLPVELLVHVAVVNTEMPYVQKVLVLTLTLTILVIWVAEPSVRRALRIGCMRRHCATIDGCTRHQHSGASEPLLMMTLRRRANWPAAWPEARRISSVFSSTRSPVGF